MNPVNSSASALTADRSGRDLVQPAPPPRVVELVLVTSAGEILGSLAPFPVATPWWPEAATVVAAARERYGIDGVILRLLRASLDGPPGGTVTYLTQVPDAPGHAPALRPWPFPLDDHPLRMPWARPGGPDADLAWADALLTQQGHVRTGPAEQIRTWNLSSLWRLPVDGGAAWLKHVPPFFSHEAAIIERLAGPVVPALIGAEGLGRSCGPSRGRTCTTPAFRSCREASRCW